MDQFSKELLAIENAYTVPQRALDCRPTIPLPLFRVYVARMSTSLPDVQIGISMIS